MNTSSHPSARRNAWMLVSSIGLAASAAMASPEAVQAAGPQGQAEGLLAQLSQEHRQLEFSGPVLAQAFAGLPDEAQAFAAQEMAGEQLVKGAPYCADAVHETVQHLPDATGAATNRIVRKQTTRLCRDGEGRTRQEVERDGVRRVYLRDPVSRENWVLDPAARTARRLGTSLGVSMQLSLPAELHDSNAWREHAERLREWARGVAERARGGSAAGMPPLPPLPPAPASAAAPAAPGAPAAVVIAPQAGQAGERQIQMRILRSEADGAAPPLPAGFTMRTNSLAPRGQGVTTALPAREIEGLKVNGERTTWTIEAGRMGNEKPIVITREVWRSPELLLTVQTSDFDPRSGETGYRLSHIRRGEPDPALMKVPADYEQRGRAPKAASAPKAKA